MFYPRESEVINWKVYVESYQADSWGGVAVSFVISLALFMFIIYISQRRLEEPTFNLSMAVRFIALSQVLISHPFRQFRKIWYFFLLQCAKHKSLHLKSTSCSVCAQ